MPMVKRNSGFGATLRSAAWQLVCHFEPMGLSSSAVQQTARDQSKLRIEDA